jgi:hypothetical protein
VPLAPLCNGPATLSIQDSGRDARHNTDSGDAPDVARAACPELSGSRPLWHGHLARAFRVGAGRSRHGGRAARAPNRPAEASRCAEPNSALSLRGLWYSRQESGGG